MKSPKKKGRKAAPKKPRATRAPAPVFSGTDAAPEPDDDELEDDTEDDGYDDEQPLFDPEEAGR